MQQGTSLFTSAATNQRGFQKGVREAHVRFPECLSVSVFLSFSSSLFLFLFLFLSLFVSFSPCHSLSICLCMSVCLYLSIFPSIYVSLSIYLSLTHTLHLSLFSQPILANSNATQYCNSCHPLLTLQGLKSISYQS